MNKDFVIGLLLGILLGLLLMFLLSQTQHKKTTKKSFPLIAKTIDHDDAKLFGHINPGIYKIWK